MVKTEFDRKLKIFQCDGGLEFDNTFLKDHCLVLGIPFRKSCADTQAWNGLAE